MIGEVERQLWDLILKLDREPFCDGTQVAERLRDLAGDLLDAERIVADKHDSLDGWVHHCLSVVDGAKAKIEDAADLLKDAREGIEMEHVAPEDREKAIMRKLIERLNARQRKKGRDAIFTEDDFGLDDDDDIPF